MFSVVVGLLVVVRLLLMVISVGWFLVGVCSGWWGVEK